jgi:hypothetical protein
MTNVDKIINYFQQNLDYWYNIQKTPDHMKDCTNITISLETIETLLKYIKELKSE